MEQFFLGINDYFLLGYSLVLLGSIFVYKELNSHLLLTIIVLLTEVFLESIRNALYDFILTLDVHSGRFVWYGFWVSINLFFIYSISAIYSFVKLPISKTTFHIKIAFWVLAFIHLAMYFDSYFTRSDFTDSFFLYFKGSVQVGMFIYLALGLKTSQIIINRIETSTHNRSVTWYQQLIVLPPEERSEEFLKWQKYTKSLSTETPIRRVK